MKVVLGSTSTHKLKAVREAFKRIGVDNIDLVGVETSTDQNEQPVGMDETFAGARSRAVSARLSSTEAMALAIGIGIESGIVRIWEGSPYQTDLDLAVIMVIAPNHRTIVTTSSGIEFPREQVNVAEKRGFKTTTVGSVIAETLGGDGTDPHATVTGGKINRYETLVDALVIALRQI